MPIALDDAVARLQSSTKFQSWRRRVARPERQVVIGRISGTRPKGRLSPEIRNPVTEKHYSPSQLTESWGVSVALVRQIFRGEPGVLKIGTDESKMKRGYKTLRIPERVAQRVHARLSA